ncbi:WW domain-binding protein 4 [Diorhabda carinulata]|uniref:WW domain-binding protein 4 n=1 Tax=Diorhabda carinulata TaxID=1163345 RepID=UPI0025A0F5EB|nr:WW domain-binding protein 4 [Diorhabda carinulata]
MADYWKSNDRKYCDFCKCWIADNKPSVDFHEKGRRHQENVKKRLKNITKASAKAHKESENVDSAIRKMEQAAMAAYRKDVESNSCADLTSIAITKKLKSENLELKDNQTKVWHEAKSKEGHIYYWNTLTNESSWEPPADGFLSIEEQLKQEHDKVATQLRQIEKHKRIEGLKLMQIQKAEEEEERARLEREKLKERRVTVSPEPVYGPIVDPSDNHPYGKWIPVKEPEYVDLQLPVQNDYFEAPVVYEPEEIKKEFKEKTIESLDDFGPSSFKKRKMISGAKKNMRKRIDDE